MSLYGLFFSYAAQLDEYAMFFEIYRFLIKTRDSESTTHNLTSQGINS
jgi:hypothetical protein